MEYDNDYVYFSKIKEYVNIHEVNLFVSYLKEVFKDLSDRCEQNKKKGVSKLTFLDYIKLPVFIGEKLFASLDVDKDGFLNLNEFVEGLKIVYAGNFEETVEMVFRLLDFDRDGLVTKGDVKILLSYLPLEEDKSAMKYKYQMESLNEIDDILSLTFDTKDTLNLSDFTKAVECKKSDAFLQILCFLYQKKPFNQQNVETLKLYKKRHTAISIPEQKNSPDSIKLPSPNRKSTLSPAKSLLMAQLVKEDMVLLKKRNSFVNETDESDNTLHQFSEYSHGMVRLPNEIIPQSESDDVNEIIKNSKNIYSSPSTFLKKPKKKVSVTEFNLEDNLTKIDKLDLQDDEDEDEKKESNEIIYEDWIFKVNEKLKIKKFYLVLIGNDIFYHKNETKDELLGMHNLSGCFVKENGEKRIEGEKYYSFLIQFAGKTRNYYCQSKASAINWTTHLKRAMGYLNFFDYYNMIDNLGEGKFGLVKLGMHKNTKQRVAIKIIKKEAMSVTDVELVKGEIDIMKLCHHRNVVRLLDHFENAEYIFIVMEYIAGGDLGEYFKKNKFQFTEQRAANVMYQIANGIKYLHQYGILHRDLKPENIMLTECSDRGEIKVMDFGLSKIMGPQEKVVDGFGTLSFVAPEVLVRTPYNKQIDIWSIGVILYFMLSGKLPFDDESDNEEVIAKMTVFMDVQFPKKYWSTRSQQVIELISLCLVKNPEKRISIDNFLNHEWIIQNVFV